MVLIKSIVRYDPAFYKYKLSTIDILRYRAGVCTEFVKIFEEMCQIAGIEVISIQGFAKGPNWKPGKS